ncbi:uncharacterized protein LOC111292556 [Durio zibethinus]|uniref:Uncharacterized protein LOC111292556 n=1 Tax=Durio zibethinus TaxID=66656 RepID=A0A6P5YKX8_DURZI|nr:uncharacterized protein LOC111292556 [Durio zibethinus]
MNKSRRRSLTLFLLWLITLSHQIQSVVCEIGQYNEEKPSFYQVVSSTMSLLKKSHKNSWEKIKTIIHDFHLQFIPPNLDFRGTGTAKARVSESVGEDMKGAVKKNIGTSKLSVEETAKSAAEFAGEAAHRTAEKVKEIVSNKEESHDEL